MKIDMRSEFVYMRYEWLSDPVFLPKNRGHIFTLNFEQKMRFVSSFLCLLLSAFSYVSFSNEVVAFYF